MVRIRGLYAEVFPGYEGVGALVVTVGDEGSYGQRVDGRSYNPSVGLKLGSV